MTPQSLAATTAQACLDHNRRWQTEQQESTTRVYRRARAAEISVARLTKALAVPGVWSEEECDGMYAAYRDHIDGHGIYETLFAVGAWLLRHRLALAEQQP